jgi:hypothetical protein
MMQYIVAKEEVIEKNPKEQISNQSYVILRRKVDDAFIHSLRFYRVSENSE